MSRQVEIATRGACQHEAGARELVVTEDGRKIAERCGGCHRIVMIRPCAGCRRSFRLTSASAKHGRRYHSIKCRQKAAQRRRGERDLARRRA